MDVLKYNMVEKAPCEKVKSWAKQHERDVELYLDVDGKLVINAMFADGKSMWISTETSARDVDINAEIIRVIRNTMDMPNSEWYATDCSKVYAAIRLSIARRNEAACLKVFLREKEYRDIWGNWKAYTDNTEEDIAISLVAFMEKVKEANENSAHELQNLKEMGDRLYAFPTDKVGWHYSYSEVEPVVKLIDGLQHLKLCSDFEVREKYRELVLYSGKLYNAYQSLSR